MSAIGPGESLVKDASDLAVQNADAIVFNGKRSTVILSGCINRYAAYILFFILYGIEKYLIQDKLQPFIITVYGFGAAMQIDLHIVFDQIGTDALYGSQTTSFSRILCMK